MYDSKHLIHFFISDKRFYRRIRNRKKSKYFSIFGNTVLTSDYYTRIGCNFGFDVLDYNTSFTEILIKRISKR